MEGEEAGIDWFCVQGLVGFHAELARAECISLALDSGPGCVSFTDPL